MYLPSSKKGTLYVQLHLAREISALLGLFFLFPSPPVIILPHPQLYTVASDTLLCGKQDREKRRAYANDGLGAVWEPLFSRTVKVSLATRLLGEAENTRPG